MLGLIVSAVLHLVGLLLTFYTLCLLCDEHLIPTVEVFIKQFEIPEEVAGIVLKTLKSASIVVAKLHSTMVQRSLWLLLARQLLNCSSILSVPSRKRLT